MGTGTSGNGAGRPQVTVDYGHEVYSREPSPPVTSSRLIPTDCLDSSPFGTVSRVSRPRVRGVSPSGTLPWAKDFGRFWTSSLVPVPFPSPPTFSVFRSPSLLSGTDNPDTLEVQTNPSRNRGTCRWCPDPSSPLTHPFGAGKPSSVTELFHNVSDLHPFRD